MKPIIAALLALPMATAAVAQDSGPLEVDVMEALVFARGFHVLLHVVELATNRGVNTVLGDQDPAGEPQFLAEGTLPQTHGVGVGDRGKAIEKHNSVQSHY